MTLNWVLNHRLLLAICLLSLLIRMTFLLALEPRASGIAAYHAITAFSVARGDGFHLDNGWLGKIVAVQQDQRRLIDLEDIEVPQDLALTQPSTDYPPGYPLLLAATFKITGQARYIYAQVLALVIDAIAAPIMLYFLGSRIFSRNVGLTAAALYPIWLSFAYLAFEPRPEAFLASVSLGLLLCLYLYLRNGGWKWLVMMAVLTAVGVNLRSDVAGTVPFLALAAMIATQGAFKTRLLESAKVGVLLVLVAFISLVPYGLIQKERFGRFAVASPAAAYNIWAGIGEYTNPWGAVLSDAEAERLMDSLGIEFRSPASETFFWNEVRKAFRDDPMWFVRTTLDRAKRIVLIQYNWGFPRAIRTALDIPGEKVSAHCETWKVLPGGATTCWALAIGYNGVAFLLILLDWSLWIGAILGAIVFRKHPYAWLLLVLPLARLIPFSFIHVEPRYILYGMGPSLVFLAALLVYAWEGRRRVPVALGAIWPKRKLAEEGYSCAASAA